MLAIAAARLGLRCHVYCDAATSPAGEVAYATTTGAYDDLDKLSVFAAQVDVVTYEFENVPVATASQLAARGGVHPPPLALEVAQDRLAEKRFIAGLGLPVAPFAPIDAAAISELDAEGVGFPAILKTRRLGYDGKGQVRLPSAEDLPAAVASLGNVPTILEGFVAFERELSVILVRGRGGGEDGRLVELAYDVPINTHKNGILDTSMVPSPVTQATEARALEIATAIAQALDYVGVLAVELFDTGADDGSGLVVNEIAPRVHNSGHWTMDGCLVDQFENHVRAIAGWPLGATQRHSDVEMRNLIGVDAATWRDWLCERGAVLHLYGKNEARAGRKMGHVNRVRPRTLVTR